MGKFISYIAEASDAGGIQHIEHPSDRTFDGEHAAKHAVNTLRGVVNGSTPVTRKIDDRMSYQVVRRHDGAVGVKYKGAGDQYAFTHSDIDKNHGAKPYKAHPLHLLLDHLHKVLPNRPGEWQGGYMSDTSARKIENGRVHHTPNTIEYSVPEDTEEGQKLKHSKVSTVIHSELHGPNREAHPVTDLSEFGHHPDVHLVDHVVSHEEQHDVDPVTKKQVEHHLNEAEKAMQGHSHEHMVGHEATMRQYINSLVGSNETPSVNNYRKFLQGYHQKKIDAVKTDKTKQSKTNDMNAALAHVDNNKEKFMNSLKIHGHVQAATNLLARGLAKSAHGGYTHIINNPESGEKIKTGPEGFVAGGLKVVDRGEGGFTAANRARSAILRASRTLANKLGGAKEHVSESRRYISEEAEGKASSNTKGVLHELLVGYHLNDGQHMDKHPDNRGDSPEQAHDKLRNTISPSEYDMINKRAKAAADDIRSHVERDGHVIHKIHWTSKPGDLERSTGIPASQHEDPSDLVISTNKGGKVTHHGVSLKVSDKKSGDVPVSNPGMESTYGGAQILKNHQNEITTKYPELNSLTNKENRKNYIRNNPHISADIRNRNKHVITNIVENMHQKLQNMTPDQIAHHIRHHVLHANPTPMQTQGHNHFKHTTLGTNNFKFKKANPAADHEHILNDPANITTKIRGTSIIFLHKNEPFAKHRIKFESQSDPMSSIKGSGELM